MEYYNNVLTVEADWLISEGIITLTNYNALVFRNQINVVRRGCRNTPALVAYDSMPERFKRVIYEKVGNPYEAARVNLIESYIVHNAEISQFFDTYKLGDGRFLPPQVSREYYNNAIVLNAIHDLILAKRQKRAALGSRVPKNWDQIAEGVQEINRTKYPHELPANPRRLEDKYKKYLKEGYVSLIHKNYLNKHAAKVNDDIKESVLTELIADPRNLDNEQIRSLYNILAEQMGWKKITRAAVGVWRDKYDLETFAGRRGIKEFNNVKGMQVKRRAPSYPLYFWTLDGWDVELLFQKHENGRTTTHNRLTMVVVLDACLKYPVGYAIGYNENPNLIKTALRNALQHTAELFGDMYRTHQIQSDRYAFSKMTPYYEAIAKYNTPAQVGNAKSKIIEPYFRYFNKKFCQMQRNWSGFGMQSRKELQPNVDFLNKGKKNFPELEENCMQLIGFIEQERAEKRERYLELWGKMPEEHKIKMDYANYLYLFGDTTGERNLLRGSGIKASIQGIKRDYDCFDLSFREHASVRWELRYDPSDLSRALAVSEDGTLRYMLEEKYVQPMALVERREGDSDELERIREYNRKLYEKVTDFRTHTQEKADHILQSQTEFETLSKLQITDSKGQHKNNRSRARLAQSAVDVEEFDEEDIYNQY